MALIATLAASCAHAAAFGWEALDQLARERAQAPYRANGDKIPAALASLNYDQIRHIRFRDEKATWHDQGLPFELQYFHLGAGNNQPVRIHEITSEGESKLPYRSEMFQFGQPLAAASSWGDIGFAGWRLLNRLNAPDKLDETVAFLGASYFRALGAGQRYGLSARGLAIDTVGARREEFPRFTEFWIQRPAKDDQQITVLALLESPSLTGAYRFELSPGTETRMTVKARVHLRPGMPAVTTLGLAPLTSMFLAGENQPHPTDFRPEVHDSDGLMVVTDQGEWLWRPLQNPRQLTVSSFAMKRLQGFGLMQRDRRFSSYEDVEARYESRPSAWIKPLGDWGAGRVELVQIPTPDETHDNIVAYWVPASLPTAGQPLDFAYELSWQGDTQQRPPSSWVTQSRLGYGYTRLTAQEQSRQPQYVLDFAGPALEALPADAPVRAVASADANGRVIEALAYPNPVTRSWRVTLRVERVDPSKPVELRAFLQLQNNTLSETWTHLLLPE